jgi:hypothetical protein
MEHETRFELAFPSRSATSHTRCSLIALSSPFRWLPKIERLQPKPTPSSRHKKARPTSWDELFYVWSTRPDSNWRPSRWQREGPPPCPQSLSPCRRSPTSTTRAISSACKSGHARSASCNPASPERNSRTSNATNAGSSIACR